MVFGTRSPEDREPGNGTNQTHLLSLVRLAGVIRTARGAERDGVGGRIVAGAGGVLVDEGRVSLAPGRVS